MTGLETALLSAATQVAGDQLLEWVEKQGDELTEADWQKAGVQVGRELEAVHKNLKASRLHKSRKPKVARQIDSAADIFGELQLIGKRNGFDETTVELYSKLAVKCADWHIQVSESLDWEEHGDQFIELFGDYRDRVE